jgi:hypothetical protein
MTADETYAKYRKMSFMQSRIPALDALSTFVPTGQEEDVELRKAISPTGFSRWFPVDGGHEVITPYQGGEFDTNRFKIKKGAWDHEHCTECRDDIEPMTFCWVTKSGRYVILCESCYKRMSET